MSEEVNDETEYELTADIYNLSCAYSVLVEVDPGLMDKTEARRLNAAKKRLLEVLINYCEALPLIEDEAEKGN